MRWLVLTLLLPIAVFANEDPCLAGDLSKYWSVGTARGMDGQVLYCEFHWGSPKNRVTYQTLEGVIIAEKEIAWDGTLTRPEIKQRDLRSGERIEVKRGEQWLMTYQEHRTASEEQTRVALNAVDVIDAGFDQKLRNHWDELMKGEAVRVVFAAPVLQRAVPLRITHRDPRHCRPVGDEDLACFWVEAGNALVRIFVDPLRLSYDQQRRLKVFEGVVNIRDEKGKKQSAVIFYHYGDGWD